MITTSIVLYKTPRNQIEAVLNSVFDSNCVDKIYIIDNSPTDELSYVKDLSSLIEYIPHENTGYGSSHNIAIKKSIELGADYHVVLNPDIQFAPNVLQELANYMSENQDVGYILPKVVYPNGELQYLCKLLPTPSDLIFRRFLPKTKKSEEKNDRYILKQSGYDKIMNPPCLSGCFMFLNCKILKEHDLIKVVSMIKKYAEKENEIIKYIANILLVKAYFSLLTKVLRYGTKPDVDDNYVVENLLVPFKKEYHLFRKSELPISIKFLGFCYKQNWNLTKKIFWLIKRIK